MDNNATGSDISERIATLARRDCFMNALGIELVSATRGRVVLRMTVTRDHLSFNGTCHGGVTFSLADAAFGLASNGHGRIAAAIHADIAFCAPVRAGEELIAEARELSLSRRVGTYRVDVRAGERLVASFTGTVHRTERPQTP